MDNGRTQTNGPEDKEVDDDAQTFHPIDPVYKLYASSKEGGRGLAIIRGINTATYELH